MIVGVPKILKVGCIYSEKDFEPGVQFYSGGKGHDKFVFMVMRESTVAEYIKQEKSLDIGMLRIKWAIKVSEAFYEVSLD